MTTKDGDEVADVLETENQHSFSRTESPTKLSLASLQQFHLRTGFDQMDIN